MATRLPHIETRWQRIHNGLATHWQHVGNALAMRWLHVGNTLALRWQCIVNVLATHWQHVGHALATLLTPKQVFIFHGQWVGNTLAMRWQHGNTLAHNEFFGYKRFIGCRPIDIQKEKRI